ncbi:MAG: DUF504 domain-containing protein [Desulfurococcales archaeon]|nr:DUF504 domain-containing protein [Desulfurococcales archaeon]
MKEGTIRAALSRVLWTSPPEELREYEVVFIDRGEPSGLSTLRLGGEVKVLRDRIVVGEKIIPLHRVLEIRRGGEVVWRRGA